MMPTDPPSLTPEERELAQRVARLGPHGEPSPALDARILSAAHAATVPASARVAGRWMLPFGVAASLALALGIAWRVRPLPETRPAYRPAAVSAVQSVSPPAQAPVETASDVDAQSSLAADASAADSTAMRKPQVSGPAPLKAEHDEVPARAASPAPSPAAEPTVVFDEPSQASASKAAGLPAPPPAPAASPMADAPQAFGASAPTATTPAARGTPRDAATGSNDHQGQDTAAEASQAALARDAAAVPAARGDEPLDDIPPATADSPAVRDAWLQRIRDLADAGDIEGARASLHEFAHRYPVYPLPDDLRKLER